MANGADTGEFVVKSRVRTGLKREFAFALKVQNEITGSLGRTRARSSPTAVPGNGTLQYSRNKRVKSCLAKGGSSCDVEQDRRINGCEKLVDERSVVVDDAGDIMSEEEAKSDVVDGASDEERKSPLGELINDTELNDDIYLGIGGLKIKTDRFQNKANGGEGKYPDVVDISDADPKDCVIEVMGEDKKNGKSAITISSVGPELKKEQKCSLKDKPRVDYVVNMEKYMAAKPTRRFTRSCITPEKELLEKGDVENALAGKVEIKTDSFENVASGGERKYPDVVDISDADLKDCVIEPGEDEQKYQNGKGPIGISRLDPELMEEQKSPLMDTPSIVVDSVANVEKYMAAKPTRRFTRSCITPNKEMFEKGDVKNALARGVQTIEDVFNGGEGKYPDVVNISDADLKDCVIEPMVEDEQSYQNGTCAVGISSVGPELMEKQKTPLKNGPSGPEVVDSVVNVEKYMAAKATRRFTRSCISPDKEILEKGDFKIALAGAFANTGGGCDEVDGTDDNRFVTLSAKKLRWKKLPTKLKDLLDTGILEGLPVWYIRGSKAARPGEAGLKGVIRGSGILCFCDTCKGMDVVTPTVYELHAGSSNKRPPEYIYMENGNSLRDVINACKGVSWDGLEEAVRSVVGHSYTLRSTLCLNCKGSITKAGSGNLALLCKSCVSKESQATPVPVTDTSDISPEPCTISKCANSLSKGGSSRSKSKGRVTRKDLGLHRLVFENDVLPEGAELAYYARGQKLLVGYKKGFGIYCSCCNCEVSPSQFEAHAGWATRRKPYLHIYTSNGVSLHELSVSLSKDRKFSSKENDDLCINCLDGGDLLCCDGCPRAFHMECVPLTSIPTGKWYCRYCNNTYQTDISAERNSNAIAAGRVAGVDPIEQITRRYIRIVDTKDSGVGGCAFCRGHDFTKSEFGPRTVILCDQCEKEFHVGCLKTHTIEDLEELPKGKWFCSADCDRINSTLQKLVVSGEVKLLESHLNAIKRKNIENDPEKMVSLDIRWRVLNVKTLYCDETRFLLDKAVSIFHERFGPIAESEKAKDHIPAMVYGQDIKGQDFGGMYCAVLMVNQVVVSAGLLRIFGQHVAELPLVATSTLSQGQGYFQALYSCIESLLASLNVRNLVLPAAKEAEAIWTSKFGFTKLNKYRKDYQMMIFQGTSVLWKEVPACGTVE